LVGVSSTLAQLNENCTVSILNRTAIVQPDGSWRIDNVPADQGQVRARATCVENGVTLSGESDFIDVEADTINGFNAEIVLGQPSPVPESLAISSPVTSLTAIGETALLTVTAIFPDGTTADVTAAASGTNYTTSNPNVATVGPDGQVTAVMSGVFLVSAMLEGALGLIQLEVMLTGDSDGDGIPDDVEIANGLDPDNPVDGFEDPDMDGLTNKEELVDFGTDPVVADTDADGIDDGEEVVAGTDGFVTNPLLADSDGDGVRDGLEVATGSDPNDPSSINLAAALSGLEVSPTNFVLFFNTVFGEEASRQLTVTGLLADGTTIDLTSGSIGTTYTSSDLFICNFGVEDGRVFAGSDGTCAVTARNSGFTAIANVTVESFSPQPVGFISVPGYLYDVDVNGGYAYVAAGGTGLQVVDVSDPTGPVLVGSLDTPGNAKDVKVLGNLAYIADGPAGLQIFDVSAPSQPVALGSFDTPGDAKAIRVVGNLVYIADGEVGGLRIVDVTNSAAPTSVGFVVTPGLGLGLDVEASLAAVADGTSGIQLIDVSDPSLPVLLGQALVSNNIGDQIYDVALVDSFAYAARIEDFSVTSVNVADPNNPVVVTQLPFFTGWAFDLETLGEGLFTADQFFTGNAQIYSIAFPDTPSLVADFFFDDVFGAQTNDAFGHGVAVDSNYVYMAAGFSVYFDSEELVDFNSTLFIGQYRGLVDTAGIPPVVTLTAPLTGESFTERTRLPVTATASDDSAVTSVDFLVDGNVVFTDTAEPYAFTYIIPEGLASITIEVQATDLGGNVGMTLPLVIPVLPDPGTTAEGSVVDLAGNPVVGASVTCLSVVGTTDLAGGFSIPDLPTILGDVSCIAIGSSPEGQVLAGISGTVVPVPGGVAAIGVIVASLRRSQGKDFWLTDPPGRDGFADPAELFILSDVTTNYSVTAPGFTFAGTVGPASPSLLPLPTSLKNNKTDQLEDKGIHVVSDAPVSILFYAIGFDEIYSGIPTTGLGTEYIVGGYQESASFRGSNFDPQPSEFVVIATQSNSSVTVLPTCTSIWGDQAGVPISLILDEGQVYKFLCNEGDVTGSIVTSGSPVAVIGGNAAADIPAGFAGTNRLMEMLLPSSLLGTEHFTVPAPNMVGDFIRIVAAEDGTSVTVDDGTTIGSFVLNRGAFEEIRKDVATHIETVRSPCFNIPWVKSLPSRNSGSARSAHLPSCRCFRVIWVRPAFAFFRRVNVRMRSASQRSSRRTRRSPRLC
jgi:hypothetical protein